MVGVDRQGLERSACDLDFFVSLLAFLCDPANSELATDLATGLATGLATDTAQVIGHNRIARVESQNLLGA
jgi:hypothetical protein